MNIKTISILIHILAWLGEESKILTHTSFQQLCHSLQSKEGIDLGYKFKNSLRGFYSSTLWSNLVFLETQGLCDISSDESQLNYCIIPTKNGVGVLTKKWVDDSCKKKIEEKLYNWAKETNK